VRQTVSPDGFQALLIPHHQRRIHNVSTPLLLSDQVPECLQGKHVAGHEAWEISFKVQRKWILGNHSQYRGVLPCHLPLRLLSMIERL